MNSGEEVAKQGVAHIYDEPQRIRFQQAVCVRNAYKHYGSKNDPDHVIRNLNMTVAKGTIYGLIGNSGCGKTTLLSCIVGRLRLNSGDIYALGRESGSRKILGKVVGYMPQQLALYWWFTIKESLMYFGWIFGLKTIEIKEKIKFFTRLLHLPNENQVVATLSFGEQRRLSFAMALIHDPELLILDEPTVGVDPLLRQSIWEHLIELTKDGKRTVIITTHYVEEARQADTVINNSALQKVGIIGLMWNGALMVEESPEVLMSKYQCLTLEDVMLKFSRKQGYNSDANIAELNAKDNIKLESQKLQAKFHEPVEGGVVGLKFHNSNKNIIQAPTYQQSDLPGENIEALDSDDDLDCLRFTSIAHFKALMLKNVLLTWRNIFVLLFDFALPVLQVITLFLAIGPEPKDLRLAIVNHDMNQSRTSCLPKNGCDIVDLGCRYLQHLNNDSIIQDFYPDVETATQAVKSGFAWGVIHITENFSDSLVSLIFRDNGDEEEDNVDQMNIKVTLDMSNKQIGLRLKQLIQISFMDFGFDVLTSCNKSTKLVTEPIQIHDPFYGYAHPSITTFVAPAMLLQIVYFMAATLTSFTFILERNYGMLDRNWVAGVTSFEILFSHVVSQFMIMCGQTALVLIFMMYVFGFECRGDRLLVMSLSILHGLCGMCFGFFMAAVCKYEENIIQISTTTFLNSFIISGVLWPVEGMPAGLRYFSQLLPQTLPVASLRNIFNRGWDLSQPEVYQGFISTIIWIVVFIKLTIIILKFKQG